MAAVAGIFVVFALAISLVSLSLAKLFDSLGNLIAITQETGVNIRDIVYGTLTDISLAIINAAPVIKEAIVTLLTILVSAICEAILTNQQLIITTLYTMLINILDGFVTYGPIIAEYLLQILDILITYVPQIVDKLWTFVITILTTVWNNITKFVINLLSKAWNKVKEVWTRATTKIKHGLTSAWNSIKYFFSGIPDWFKDIGSNMLNGLLNDLKSVWDKITRFFSNLASGIKTNWDTFWNMHSPSKVFAKEGEYMMLGLANGLEDNASEATNAMSDIISAIGNTLDEDLDDDLVITPVVDLTNVTNGARDINSIMDSINGSKVSVSTGMARSISSNINNSNREPVNQNWSVTNNSQTDNYYNTFNNESDEPEEVPRQVDIILQQNRLRNNLAKGGA